MSSTFTHYAQLVVQFVFGLGALAVGVAYLRLLSRPRLHTRRPARRHAYGERDAHPSAYAKRHNGNWKADTQVS